MTCRITSSKNPIFLQNVLPRGKKEKKKASTEDLKLWQKDLPFLFLEKTRELWECRQPPPQMRFPHPRDH